MLVRHFHAEPLFPPAAPPAWSRRVERWYQLDAPAYLLPAAFAGWGIESRPRSMILACAGASNATDHAFAAGGAASPAKFVHTLPNVRASALLAVMGWSGPVLTLQRGETQLAEAFREAAAAKGECWVWSLRERLVDLFVFHGAGAKATHEFRPGTAVEMAGDMAILRSFWDSESTFSLEHWVVRKR